MSQLYFPASGWRDHRPATKTEDDQDRYHASYIGTTSSSSQPDLHLLLHNSYLIQSFYL